jgi:transposase InsO family protein
VIGVAARTVQRWQKQPAAGHDGRRGPRTAPPHQLSGAEKDEIVQLVNQPAYRNLSPEQAVAKLAGEGIYVCSERSLRRVLAERKLDRYRRRCQPARPQHRPRPYVACEPLKVLSWDITYLRSSTVRGGFFYLYLFLDIWSRRIVGAEVHEVQQAEIAAALLTRVCIDNELQANELVVHSDNGAPMKGSTMLATMQSLGIVPSFSRPSVSDDNAFAESLFRHLKYAPSYPRHGFATLDDARAWVTRFVDWYNREHLHSAIALVTPDDRHYGRDIAILEKRRTTYALAQQLNPRRWTTAPRAWTRPTTVSLNPERSVITSTKSETSAA